MHACSHCLKYTRLATRIKVHNILYKSRSEKVFGLNLDVELDFPEDLKFKTLDTNAMHSRIVRVACAIVSEEAVR